jgi:hypothetical protein
MKLLDDLLYICRRLAPRGWGNLFALHGMHLNAKSLSSPSRLASELKRNLTTIDRTVGGFEDFSPAGTRGVEGGKPNLSLLYHAFASPLVHPVLQQEMSDENYPTLEELDIVENYIYARAKASFKSLKGAMPRGSRLVVSVFAYQYRIGARSPDGKFADVAFSRTGVSRVGTHHSVYQAHRRSFWPVPGRPEDQIAVMPARYAAFLAEWRTPTPDDSILSEQAGDEDRSFLFPVHKLFDGKECLKGSHLKLKFEELHQNEKLHKIHTEKLAPIVSGFNIFKPPFMRQSGLVRLKRANSSVLLVPIDQKRLTSFAMQRNANSRRKEIVRFVVPRATTDNRFAISSFQYLDATHAERRTAPEYVNIRHRVISPFRLNNVQDINHLPRGKFLQWITKGGYEAAHFVDNTCEGCITVDVPALKLDKPDRNNFAAYSLVCAPDFFPLVDQADVMDWVTEVLKRNGEREHFAQGGPRPLSRRRNCINPHIVRRNSANVPASAVRDPMDQARTETLTAIVAASKSHAEGDAPTSGDRYADPSTTFLSDAASGIFDPGWDVSFSGNPQADFFAGYGLGNPFPEDAKLCAALNSFWPSVAPDATRTFGLFPPEWEATTAIPLLDSELGYYPSHPLVVARKVKASTGWDGECGPFFEKGFLQVNHADIALSDYVSHALAGTITLDGLAHITPREFFRRMNALRACIAVLPELPKRVSTTRLFLVSANKVDNWSRRAERADPRLDGDGYLFEFAILQKNISYPPQQHGRARRPVRKRYTCQIGAQGVCWKLEVPGKRFIFSAVPLFV